MAIPQTSGTLQTPSIRVIHEPRPSRVQLLISWFIWALHLLLAPVSWSKQVAGMFLCFSNKILNKLNSLSCLVSCLIAAWAVLSISHVFWDVCLLAPLLHKAHLLASGGSHEGVVFGVLSGRDHFMQRLAVRNTWASDLRQTSSGHLPSKILFVVGQEDCHIHPKLRIPSHSCQAAWNEGPYAAKWNSTSFPTSSDSENKVASLITGLSFVALTDVFIASILVHQYYFVSVQFESGKAEFFGKTIEYINGSSYVEVKINRFVAAKEAVEILVSKHYEQPSLASNKQCQWSNGSSSVKYNYVKLHNGRTQPWTDDLCVPFTVKFENGKTQCPPKWELYNGHCYYLSTKRLSWYMAVDSCIKFDAMLTSVTDEEENHFLSGENKFDFRNIWIGLHASTSSSTFQWKDGSTANYRNWDDYQPNNYLGSERCVQLFNVGTWTVKTCSLPVHYICKKPRVSKADLQPELSQEAEQQLQQQWHEGLETTRQQVALEQRLYGDLLIIPDLIDTQYSLPHKLLALLQWTASEHPGYWLFKADDDTLVNVRRVMGLLHDREFLLPSLHNCGVAVSHFMQLLPLPSNNSLGKEHRFRADFSPLLPLSAGYLLSDEVVSGLAVAAPQLGTYSSEAVSLGVWLSALSFSCTASPAAFWDAALNRMMRTSHSMISGVIGVLEELMLAQVPISKAARMDSTAASLKPLASTTASAALVSHPCWHRTEDPSCSDKFVVAADLSLDEIDKLYKTYLR